MVDYIRSCRGSPESKYSLPVLGPFPTLLEVFEERWPACLPDWLAPTIGELLAALAGPFLFSAFPDSNRAENTKLRLGLWLFLVSGVSGAALCWRWTAGWARQAKQQDQNVGIVLVRTRSLAIVTGLVAGVTASTGLGLLGVIVPTFLVVAAIAQPRSQRYGFWLMLGSAVMISSWMLPFGVLVVFDSFRMFGLHHDYNMMVITLWAASLLLLVWCLRALMVEGFRLKLF
jgi:hypothetical protein